MQALPTIWTTDRLIMRDSVLEEAERLCEIFNANQHIGPWDPTFQVIDTAEIERLIHMSNLREEPGHDNFQMQSVYEHEAGQIIGYFHCYHGVAKDDIRHDDISFISMFVLDPKWQQHGYGGEIVDNLVDLSQSLGDRASLGVRVYLKNWPALRFWTNQNFRHIARMDGDREHGPDTHASFVLFNKLKG